ncbi:C-C motif chemokine 8-like [Chelmon rostratus]|uniref:C-C motif chemokine 8-like n=1 Tax=Chelmon rostratus TaxID=109905 RepID=UPI001BE877FD|nr:C-C motif chemokine 8-like [Chelmon rostratus]
MASRVAVLFLLGVICFGFVAAEIVVDCCLTTTKRRLPIQILDSYIIQDAGKGCDIGATAFITKVGKTLCVSHHSELPWVKSYIDFLEKKKQGHQ